MPGLNEEGSDLYHSDNGHDDHEEEVSSNPVKRLLDQFIPRGGLLSSSLTLASSTLGATVLALPITYQQCGILLASFFLVICGCCTIFSVHLLARAHRVTGIASYELLSRVLFGRVAEWLTGILMVVFCWGTAVAYIMSCGDVFRQLVPDNDSVPHAFRGQNGRRLMMFMFWSVTMLPMSLAKELNAIRYFTFVGVSAIVYFICILVWYAFDNDLMSSANLSQLSLGKADNNMVVGLATILFAYCCQPNVYEVYTEMPKAKRTPKGILNATMGSMTVCTVLYLIAGFFGYADFGINAKSDVLKNFHPYTNYAIFVSYVCFTIKITVAYSLNIHPSRDSILALFKMGSYHEVSDVKRWAICFALSTAALVFALYIESIETVFGFLGGLCGSAIGFVLPCLYVMYSGEWNMQVVGKLEFVGTWAMLLFGVIAMVFGTAGSIYSAL